MTACEIPLFPKMRTFLEMSSRRFGLSWAKNYGLWACGRDLFFFFFFFFFAIQVFWLVWVVLFVIFLVIIGQEGGYTYNFMGGFGPKGIYAAGGAVFTF